MTYDTARNSYEGWRLAIAAMREIAIRKGEIQPRTPAEQAWAAEGFRGVQHLATVAA